MFLSRPLFRCWWFGSYWIFSTTRSRPWLNQQISSSIALISFHFYSMKTWWRKQFSLHLHKAISCVLGLSLSSRQERVQHSTYINIRNNFTLLKKKKKKKNFRVIWTRRIAYIIGQPSTSIESYPKINFLWTVMDTESKDFLYFFCCRIEKSTTDFLMITTLSLQK